MSRTYAEILAAESGFSHYAPVNMSALVCRAEVRDMCASGRCRRYDRCWSCPPACGTIEENAAALSGYTRGFLVQTTGKLEDEFDLDGMKKAEALHKTHFNAYVSGMRSVFPACLPLGAGSCTICMECAYPDNPCRFPERRVSSMEAFGLWVSDVCEKSGLAYNYGPQTITYVSCVLF